MMWSGYRVVVSEDSPKYTLPEELIPGVPWPPGFRDEINTWSKSFLGYHNNLKPGQSYVIEDHTIVVHPTVYKTLRKFTNESMASS